MKRILLTFAATLALAATAVPAAAQQGPGAPPDGFPPRGGEHDFQPGEAWDHPVPWVFRGVVVSVDADAGTFDARARLIGGPHAAPRPDEPEPGDDPAAGEPDDVDAANTESDPEGPVDDTPAGDGRHDRQVHTFHASAETHIHRNGQPVDLAALEAGDLVYVVILAPWDATLEEAVATPAMFVAAHSRPVFYGFAGRVHAVDAEAGTITVAVRYMTRAARRIARGHRRLMTFSVGEHTRVTLNGRDAELADFSPGDLAGVGFVGARRMTLEEMLALPADVLIGRTRTRGERRTTARLGRRAARGARRAR